MRKLSIIELNRLSSAEYDRAEKIPLIIVLDNLRSCNNIGSIFRTSDAFLVEKIYLCGITATPPNKEIHKTALDAEMVVNWSYFNETVEAVKELKSEGVEVFAVEQVEQSTLLNDFQINTGEKVALIFGNEVRGVDQNVVDMCDGTIEIPQFGTKHSLNVSVSAGIVIWELFRKMRKI